MSNWNYNPWCCSKLFFYYVSPLWNLVQLQQITLIKKHKGNLPLLLVCTWCQRLLFSGYFHVNSLRKNSTLLTPQNAWWWLQTKNYWSQLIDCCWMLSIMALGHFWAILKKLLICQWHKRMYLWAKAPEIVQNEKLQCRTIANQDSDVMYCKRRSYSGFCIGEETMDVIICEEQWLVLTKELIKCTADVEGTQPERI